MRYAVKWNGQWYVCVKVKREAFGFRNRPDEYTWSDTADTSWVCDIGEEERLVELD